MLSVAKFHCNSLFVLIYFHFITTHDSIYIYIYTLLTVQSLFVSIRTGWFITVGPCLLSTRCSLYVLYNSKPNALYDSHRIVFLTEANFFFSDVRTECVYVCSLMLSFSRSIRYYKAFATAYKGQM